MEANGNNKWYVPVIVIVIVIIGTYFIVKPIIDNNKVIEVDVDVEMFKENIQLEIGEELDILNILVYLDLLGGDYIIKILYIDEEGNEIETILTVQYFDLDGNEVDKETAVIIEAGKEKLKEGYYKKEYITECGKYKIIIIDKDNKEYETVITIRDTVPPELKLKEVTINERAEININDFIGSCTDNSGKECTFYFVGEEGNEITEIPSEVGEHIIRIIAKDPSGNITKIQETKLIINKVIEEPVDTSQNSDSSNSSSKNSSGSSSSNSSNKASSNTGSSTNTSEEYDTSNPIVSKALSLVGEKMVCTDAAQRCLQVVGKSLWVEEVTGYRNIVTWDILGGSEADKNKVYFTHTFEVSNSFTINDEGTTYPISEVYHTSNNIITKVEAKGYPEHLAENYANYTNSFAGKQTYTPTGTMSSYYEGNIKKIATEVSLRNIKPGDFLYYEKGSRPTTHIAIYIGNNKAVHGGWTDGYVCISGISISARPIPTVWRVK